MPVSHDDDVFAYEQETRRLAKGGGLLFAGQLAHRLLLAGGMALVANLLGAAQFGLFALARNTVQALEPLLCLGLPEGAVRYVAIHDASGAPDKVKGTVLAAFGFVVGAGAAAAVALWIAAGRVAEAVFHKSELSRPLQLMGLAIPFVALARLLGQSALGRKNAGPQAAQLLTFAAAFPLCFLVFYYLTDVTAWHAVVCFGVAVALSVVAAAWGVSALFPELRDRQIHAKFTTGALLAFSAPLMLADLSNLGVYQVNTALAGIWVDSHLVGAYAVANFLAFFGTVGLVAVRSVFSPSIAHLHSQGLINELARLFKTTTRWSALLGLPVLAFLIVEAGPILGIVGHEYLDAVVPLQLLCLGHVVNVLTGAVGFVLTMTGHQWQNLATTVAMAVLNILLCVFLTPAYLVSGTAIAAAVAVAAFNVVKLGQVWYHVRVWPYDLSILKPIISTLAAAGVLLLLGGDGLFWLLARLMVFVAVVVVVYVLLGINDDDRIVLAALRKRFAPGSSGNGQPTG